MPSLVQEKTRHGVMWCSREWCVFFGVVKSCMPWSVADEPGDPVLRSWNCRKVVSVDLQFAALKAGGWYESIGEKTRHAKH